MGKTLYEKVYDAHVVYEAEGELPLLYIDRHLVHEVTSPQAFAGLREAGRVLRRPELIMATMDHDISTRKATIDACSCVAKKQVTTLIKNCEDFGVTLFGLGHPNQGIVHIIGPQTGFTVMVTQTIKQAKLKTMRINCVGKLPEGVYAKDLILEIARVLTTAGATGYAIEFAGDGVRSLSMEARMTLSNMAIEIGAKAGMIAPDETTFAYLKDRPYSPKGEDWDEAVRYWKSLASDEDAVFDKEVTIDSGHLTPMVTWGTNPGQVCHITDNVPDPKLCDDEQERHSIEAALAYIQIDAGKPIKDVPIGTVFIGSCTNGRIEDFREAAKVLRGRHIAQGIRALAVPGSMAVKAQAEKEGLDQIFKDAGFEWRLPGCSMCLGMNDDIAAPGSRVASTSNRNFVGRQGRGSRTHLMSPAMAAAAAINGKIVDVRDYLQ